MDVRMPDGTIIQNVPEGTTKEELLAKLGKSGYSLPVEPVTPKNEAFERGKNLTGALRGLISVAQGPTLGFADEIGGLVGGVLSAVRGDGYKSGYQEVRDQMRGAADFEQKQNPITSAITRGMAAAPLAAANAGASLFAPSLLGRTGLAATQGGAFGAVTGAGESNADTIGGVLADSAKGGALGAAMGGVVTPVAAAVGGVARNAGARAAPAVEDLARRFGFDSFADGVNRFSNRYANEKVAEALLRDAGKNPEARNVVANSVREMRNLGPEARLVDSGGENTMSLLDTLATLPGQTKQSAATAIKDRVAGRADRLINSAESSLFGADAKRMVPQLDAWAAQRAEEAKPLYEQLYKQGVFIDDNLKAVIEAAKKLGAAGEARTLATAKMQPFTLDSPNVKWAGMRELDLLKQGLDDKIAASVDNMGNMSKVGGALIELKNNLLKNLDEQTGGLYKQARDAYAGPSQLRDAAMEGRKILSQDALTAKKVISDLSASEQEAFKLGAYEALRAKLASPSGQTEVLGMWKNKGLNEKLQNIFPDEKSFQSFVKTATGELKMKGIERVRAGSQTAERQYGAGDMDVPALGEVAGLLGSATSNNPVGMLGSAFSAWNKVKTPEPVRDKMGEVLLSQGRAGQRGLLDLANTVEEVNATRLGRAGLLGGMGGFFGGGYVQ